MLPSIASRTRVPVPAARMPMASCPTAMGTTNSAGLAANGPVMNAA